VGWVGGCAFVCTHVDMAGEEEGIMLGRVAGRDTGMLLPRT
jgi:hypothetical protein